MCKNLFSGGNQEMSSFITMRVYSSARDWVAYQWQDCEVFSWNVNQKEIKMHHFWHWRIPEINQNLSVKYIICELTF